MAALAGPMLTLTPSIRVESRRLEVEWEREQWPDKVEVLNYQVERLAELEQAQIAGDAGAVQNLSLLAGWAREMLDRPLDQPWPPPPLELCAARLGELSWVAVPGELYVEHGLSIKQRGGEPAWILGYTNGDLGYFPTQAAFDRQDYEASLAFRYYGYPAPYARATGQNLVETASQMLGDEKR